MATDLAELRERYAKGPQYVRSASISPMDGGGITAPNVGIWTEDGFVVENVGVPPDIEVEQTPQEVMAGRDPQLEKAIQVVLEELKKNPPKTPQRPSFPIRVRK